MMMFLLTVLLFLNGIAAFTPGNELAAVNGFIAGFLLVTIILRIVDEFD